MVEDIEQLLRERTARLEEKQVYIEKQAEKMAETQQLILKSVKSLDTKMDSINDDITKYKGFIGGVTLVVTSIGVIAAFFKSWVLTKLGFPT